MAKTVTVEGSSVFVIPPNMTRIQAKEEAIRRAKIDALNNAFGNTIFMTNAMITTEKDEHFYSNGFELVKGEWIETIGEPEIKTCLEGETLFLSVKIKGKAREKKTAEVDISVKVLRNGTSPDCETTVFKNGDKMYLRFKSPADGNVSVYQHDPNTGNVFCLLPYKKEGTGSVKVEHDKEYVFFSKSESQNPKIVDEYRMGCGDTGEVNTLYILFSPQEFTKTSTDANDKYTPRSMPFSEFETWKARCMAVDYRMQVTTQDIIINK